MSRPVKALIVDDSALVRRVLSDVLSADPGIEVIATAHDPIFAMRKMKQQWPDVIVLDIEMPRMDGLTFLRKLMKARPTPVVICSTLTVKGAETTMQALSAGAVSIITKPTAGLSDFLNSGANDVVSAVKGAAQARLRNLGQSVARRPEPVARGREPAGSTREPAVAPVATAMSETTQQVVAIGTSTGGTQALERVLTALPAVTPGIVIVQHMPEKFTAMFAERLNSMCRIEVREARDNDRVFTGRALIAPGGRHMELIRRGAQYHVRLTDAAPVNRHKPSVDVLFHSVAEQAGRNAAGFILTGMGDDGARGLLAMSRAGAHTVAQDEDSCIVFGMPRSAIGLGGVAKVLSLDKMAGEIMRSVSAAH
ncbi:chemotaxis response regulator protein-glutamate methylesterase [Wenzhouxiangella sp. AB-CW3]|uniref:protein-glutamate methylesterase/protein-glutamine glutaminase n=1 Tax=Wenzhouxiangella sp. AB-CW3 TaxID=2771012 RepID=UPI001CC2DC6A|nr:chemotaxis response regulator protein-glutamate methylesterase [Wenzhouxiangella sp. AB-CW3]